jgi:hypothetical protein
MALGLPAPELQVDFYDERGFIGTVDFYWPELELIGEFDGEVKYGAQRRYQRSLSPTQVLIAEKEREDRLRRVSKNFARWGWKVALDRPRLANLLRPFGLVAGR